MEKIINEFRVIETDDGFRIEIKGDKEKIKAFMRGFRGQKHRHGWHQHRRRGWGPFGFDFGPWLWMKMGSCWGPWDFETEEGEEPEGSKKA